MEGADRSQHERILMDPYVQDHRQECCNLISFNGLITSGISVMMGKFIGFSIQCCVSVPKWIVCVRVIY